MTISIQYVKVNTFRFTFIFVYLKTKDFKREETKLITRLP